MQRDLGSLAKTCRNLQLKLRRTQQQQLQKAKDKEEQLQAAAAAALSAEVDLGSRLTRSSQSDLSVKKTLPSIIPEPEPEPEPELEAEAGGELWRSAAIWSVCNKIVVVQNKSSLLKIILQNPPTLQLFTIDKKQKLFTKDFKSAKQQSLGLEELGIL